MTAGGGPVPAWRSEPQQLVRLAIPLAAQQIGAQLMGSVDAAMLGRYSDTAIAAAGIGNNLLFAITSIGLGLVLGLDSVVPRAVGARREEDARRYLDAGLRLAVIVGALATLVVMASPLVLLLVDVDPAVAAEARIYVHVAGAVRRPGLRRRTTRRSTGCIRSHQPRPDCIGAPK